MRDRSDPTCETSRASVLREERGFSLIELPVVVLLVAVLAAIAIAAFLDQKSMAYDASAKELAPDVRIAAETFATDQAGSYANLTPAALAPIDATIQTAAGNGDPHVASVSGANASRSGRSARARVAPTSTRVIDGPRRKLRP